MTTMVTFSEITPYQAIKEIYKHKRCWSFLHECIDNSQEVVERNGKIDFNHFGKVYYINEEEYSWIAGYDGDKICFLQFIKRPVRNSIELVIAEKRSTTKTKAWFGNVVEYIKKEYPKVKRMTTFPMNETLKEYYKKFGFENYKMKELKLKVQ